MALIEMDFATGVGEHYEEILLWENASPSASMSSQLITLSDDYTQYDLIKVVFKCAASGADNSKRYIRNVYQTPEDIQNTQNDVNYACAGLGRRGASTSVCDFIGIGTSNTNVNYYHLDTANLIIPLSIYGVRKVGGSADNEGELIWTNPNDTLTLASGQITLSSNLSNFTKLRIRWYVGGSSAVTRDEAKECEALIPVAIIPTGATNAPGIGGVVGNTGSRYFYHNSGDADNTLRCQVSIATSFVPYEIYGIK